MKLYRVPMLNDYTEFRGSFIFSTMISELAFLDARGHLHRLNSEIQGAILSLFKEQEVRPPPPEFLPRINPPARPTLETITMIQWLTLGREAKKIFTGEPG